MWLPGKYCFMSAAMSNESSQKAVQQVHELASSPPVVLCCTRKRVLNATGGFCRYAADYKEKEKNHHRF